MSKGTPTDIEQRRLDAVVNGRPLRELHARFAGHFVETRNAMQAYRMVFVPDKNMASRLIHDRAQALLKDPDVVQRVQELRDLAASETIVTIRQLIEDYNDIATADPNELVSNVVDCCRFCYGIDHRYQWRDEGEYAEACDLAVKKTQPLPDMSGGFGFNASTEPLVTCPCCYGRGESRQLIHDTRKLSPAARKLYAGMAKGEVLMHDQMKARDALGRILGAFKDGVLLPTAVPAREADKPVTVEDAGRSYLQLVSSK